MPDQKKFIELKPNQVVKKKKFVAFVDSDGMPRAWGTAELEADAEAEARRQLTAYCAKKKQLGDVDLADEASYSKRVVDVEVIENEKP